MSVFGQFLWRIKIALLLRNISFFFLLPDFINNLSQQWWWTRMSQYTAKLQGVILTLLGIWGQISRQRKAISLKQVVTNKCLLRSHIYIKKNYPLASWENLENSLQETFPQHRWLKSRFEAHLCPWLSISVSCKHTMWQPSTHSHPLHCKNDCFQWLFPSQSV